MAGTEFICLKLKKEFFQLVNDIFIIYSYCAPSTSAVLQRAGIDIFDDLGNLLSDYINQGDIIVAGDLNARTGIEPDFIIEEDNSHIPVPPFCSLYEPDTVATEIRNNQDGG